LNVSFWFHDPKEKAPDQLLAQTGAEVCQVKNGQECFSAPAFVFIEWL